MSTLRYDPAHRPGPARTGRSRRRIPRDWPVRAGATRGWLGSRREPGSFLSVVVPAKNEAASCRNWSMRSPGRCARCATAAVRAAGRVRDRHRR